MKTRHRNPFTTVRTEGAILPPDLLAQIAEGSDALTGLKPADYHLQPGEKLNEAISRSWNRLIGAWETFRAEEEKLPEISWGTSVTRERWLLPLFQELGYGRLQTRNAVTLEGKSYAISHGWGQLPVHLLGCRIALDRRTPGAAGAARVSPHSMVQEFLNRTVDALWAILTNGLQLRILRDNASLTRQAYVAFDLEAMMTGEVYADFVLLWLLCHQSRVEGDQPEDFILEKWSRTAHEQGARALDQLRDGVETAIRSLGSGFLRAPENQALRESLRHGTLDAQDYYRQLLRMVYQLIFLFVAEDRGLLFPPDSDPLAQERYTAYYSTQRLRHLAERSRGQRHSDLYHIHRLVTQSLGAAGCPKLALPALGGFIFSPEAIPDLDGAELPNRAFLDAIRALAFTVDERTLRPVDYKNLGPEELGSVYESLLELHPRLDPRAAAFELRSASGSERKTTGSYYTPTSLIQELLDSALEPVIAQRLKNADDPESVLLNLTVCDPASGSGHFLIAAAHRLARVLAAVRTGEDEPAPEATRAALRDVIRRCLYGVDVNPMAVELCKFSLWMEALDPGKPLTFLDAHIKCGNSLVGVGPELNIDDLPDDAFQPAFGDDRSTATALRRRNKRERQGQMGFRWETTLLKTREDLRDWMRSETLRLEHMPEEAAEQLRAKEKAYQTLISAEGYQRQRLAYDLWTSAFFWPIPKGNAEEMLAPTQQELRSFRKGDPPDAELARRAREIAEAEGFFHWPLEFPAVFDGPQPGFDVVLGNPPWEMLQLNEKEYFADKAPEIADLPGARRKNAIKKLEEEDPLLWEKFLEAKKASDNQNSFFRNSGRYPLSAFGKLNSYALFAGHVRQIFNAAGRVGVILPTGIATDFSTKDYFGDVVDQQQLVSLFDFENREGLFAGVHRSYKFCLFTLSGAPVDKADFIFFAANTGDLRDPIRRFSLSPQEIASFNPNTRTMPVFRTRPDADLTRMIYKRVPVLDNEQTGENPWGISFKQGLFNMTSDSDLFVTEPRPGYVRLYEAKMFWHYDHRWATFDGDDTRSLTLSEKNDPNVTARPRYWVPKAAMDERLENWPHDWLMGFRDVTNATNERTSVFSIIPKTGVGHTAPLIICTIQEISNALFFLGGVNSFIFDYCARQKMGGTHMTFYLLRQLPVLRQCKNLSIQYFITKRIIELIFTANDIRPIITEICKKITPFRWDEERRALIRAELDAYFARLYGLNRKQLRYILDPADLTEKELADILDPAEEVADPLDVNGYAKRSTESTFPGETFRVLKDKEIRQYGEYRTRRLVLTAWQRMQDALDSGTDYVPLVDPPPAHPSLCHPWPDGTPYEGPGLALDKGGQPNQSITSIADPVPPAVDPPVDQTPAPAPAEESEHNARPTDWSLYKCRACGQILAGFARAEHIKKNHPGQNLGFEKM
jgi:hypothetical protein